MTKIAVLFLTYGDKYPNSFERLQEYLKKLNCNKTIFIIDNKIEESYEEQISENIIKINGNNKAWEFSGWDEGLKYLRENKIYDNYDAFLFVNDSFEAPGAGKIENIINDGCLHECIINNKPIMSLVTTPHYHFELNSKDVSQWYRSNCFMFSKKVVDYLKNIQSYDINFLNRCIPDKPGKYFYSDAPLNINLKNMIPAWLSGWWHSAFKLEDDWNLYRMKTLAFMNELMLSRRIIDMEQDIKFLIDQVDTVMFDVFDTCILRKVNQPEEIFKLLGNDFRKNRLEAQFKAEAYFPGEYDLHAIYKYFYEEAPLGKFDNSMMQKEIDLELACSYRNTEVYAMYEYAKKQNKKIIFVSDMYLSSEHIMELLNKNDYEVNDIEDIHVSCEYDTRKSTGQLYKDIIELYNLNPNKCLMIGDNKHSDYDMAISNGLKAYHYIRKQTEGDFWFRVGYNTVGPILLAYITWLKEELRKDNITEVYFFAREGYIFKQVYDLLKTKEDANSYYLYLSRKSMNIPLLADLTLEQLKEKYKGIYWHLTTLSVKNYRDYLKFFGVDYQKTPMLDYFLDEDLQTLTFIEREKKLQKVFDCNYKHIQKAAKVKLENAIKYFEKNIHYSLNDNIAVVDLGWGGSMQESLQLFMDRYLSNDLKLFGYYLANDKRINDRKDKQQMKVFYENNHVFQTNAWITELLFNAVSGTCLEYDTEGNPILDENNISIYCNDILKGSIDFIKDSKYMLFGDIKKFALSNFARLIESPTEKESYILGNLEFYSSGSDGIKNYIAKPDLSQLEQQYTSCLNKIMFKQNLRTAVEELIRRL